MDGTITALKPVHYCSISSLAKFPQVFEMYLRTAQIGNLELLLMNNIDKYREDFDSLVKFGDILLHAINNECNPLQLKEHFSKTGLTGKKFEAFINSLPLFRLAYQRWYSEALALIRQLMPNRLADFVKYYEKPKQRKVLSTENYSIEDYLQGNKTAQGWDTIEVKLSSAVPQFVQQLQILKSIEKRFESSLFDIQQLVQADLLDSEIDGAKELLKNKFIRAAGVVAGVILEKHLAQVCKNHSVLPTKSNPTISVFNEQLKNNNVIDTPTWRSIGFYADIRNNCGHGKDVEPTADQVKTLIDGVEKLTRILF